MSMQEFSDNLSTLSYISKRRIPLWVYDPKQKSFLGRTFTSWALCILFYIVYYSCLASFFMGMMLVFLHTQVPEMIPSRTGMHSILQLKPGLGFRPMVDVQKSLIKYSVGDPQEYLKYTENIDAFMESYHAVNSKPQDQFAKCDEGVKVPNDAGKVCKFKLDRLHPCDSKNNFSYSTGSPCVILKINKIYGWLPDIENTAVSQNILVNCTGQNPADVENIGELDYYPGTIVDGKKYGIFEHVYFPYIGQAGYLSPLVAVQFQSLHRHVAVLVECQLRNIRNAYEVPLGFEILVN